jgi:hypothetical protein
MERAYCLSCGREMVTESGQVCAKCATGEGRTPTEGMGALAYALASIAAVILGLAFLAPTGCTTGKGKVSLGTTKPMAKLEVVGAADVVVVDAGLDNVSLFTTNPAAKLEVVGALDKRPEGGL